MPTRLHPPDPSALPPAGAAEPGPYRVDEKKRYHSGAKPATKQTLSDEQQARYQSRSLQRRQAVGLKAGHSERPPAAIGVRRLAQTGDLLVRTTPFAQGTFSSVADAVMVRPARPDGQPAEHGAAVLKKASLRPGASKGSGGRSALEDTPWDRLEQELRQTATFAPRLAPRAVLHRGDVVEVVLGERFAGDGKSLGDALRSSLHVAGIVDHLAHALFSRLAQLHADGVVHRDIKPENVLVSNRQADAGGLPSKARFVLGDYGLAVQTDGQPRQDPAGSDGYRAPELFVDIDAAGANAGKVSYGCPADLFSAGATLIDILVKQGIGQSLFYDGDGAARLKQTGIKPATYNDFFAWREELLADGSPLDGAKLAASDLSFRRIMLSAWRAAPAAAAFAIEHLLVEDPQARCSAAEARDFFAQRLQQGDPQRAVAEIDRLTGDPRINRKLPAHRYDLADLRAAADVLANRDHEPLPGRDKAPK